MLKEKKGDFNAKTTLPPVSRNDLEWWATHIADEKWFVVPPRPGMTIETDTSSTGWGGLYQRGPSFGFGGTLVNGRAEGTH